MSDVPDLTVGGTSGAEAAGYPEIAFVAVCLAALIAFRLAQPRAFLAWVRNLRWERLLHYLAMFALGVYMSDSPAHPPVALAAAGLAVALAWATAIVNNDLVDFGIDRVSNPDRPLPTGALDRRQYARLGLVMALLSLAGSLCVSASFAACVAASLAAAFVYSTPPLRLRRYLIVSSALIAVASLSVAVGGFVCLGHRTLADFPRPLGGLLLLAMTCGANFKDVKDYEGDRTEGIQTLVTLLGPRWGQIAAGGLVAGAMIAAPFVLQRADLFVPSVACGAAAMGIALHRRFHEKLMLLTYFLYLLLLLRAGVFRTP